MFRFVRTAKASIIKTLQAGSHPARGATCLLTEFVRRPCRLTLAPVLAVFIAGMVAAPARAYTDDQLTESFLSIVFGSEYPSFGWRSNQVKKFVRPVRVYIDNRAKKDRRRVVTRFVSSLPRWIGGLQVILVDRPAQANYRIFVVDQAQYHDVVRKEVYRRRSMKVPGHCLARVWSTPSGITRSDAVIVSDRGEFLFRRCLVEEVLQGLGPVNDNSALKDSIFNDKSRHIKFTKHDRYILNMLYHPRIRPGMSKRQARAVLPKVIADTRRRIR